VPALAAWCRAGYEIRAEVAALRCEAKAAHKQIKELKREKAAPTIIGWKVDRIVSSHSILCRRQARNADPAASIV
jgi:hypothetical protein